MIALLRSELLKQRSTRTALALFAGMLGLVLLAVLLHVLGLPTDRLADRDAQLMVLGRGEYLGVLFAALVGALSVTSEIRYGTIRPTFLFSPRRMQVVAAKVWLSVGLGAGFGLLAGAAAVIAGTAALRARDIPSAIEGSDRTLLVVGAAVAAALWGAIGVGIGALLRNQVPTLIAITAWLLFVEGLLVGDVGGLGQIGRFLPGSAAAAVSGQELGTLLAPGVGLVVLVGYSVVIAVAGAAAMARRDVG
jgi:ABC-2 type transport system permease protein